MAHIVTIAGSPSATSRSAAMLDYFRRELEHVGHTVHAVSVRDMNADDLIHGRYDGDSIRAQVAQVERAQGVILATPVYKASYTGVLKLFLDVLPANALQGKAALPLVSGAAPTHMLVLDYALKPVVAALGAWSIHPGLYVMDQQFQAAQPGSAPTFTPELEEKLKTVCASFAHLLENVIPSSM
ncbi:MAG: NADPH-dependent FMN reductase [bacterium]|nr:NADPH-dependent FMN reductase [bacterium]